ncbi:hypothetical protein QRW90_16625 [Clostridioides difficile]|uniref:hypothetical protein n=1 Tax=Clostridioides difficile TaxID=1496 RepID=UPI001266AAD7|nr:hypothetical protein [Clostridioides difficile]MDL5120607.1 hypothetical protein [Clostridioides difficile]QFS33405.1 hypothetical protein FTB24_19400 [Clostridioides difficile]QIF80174.1 hypothetical protein EUU24_17020 [Clostridioides difficile]
MSNYIIGALEKLEIIERKYGLLGTIIGIILIILTLFTTLFAINIILKFSIEIIQWIFINFFGFKLY